MEASDLERQSHVSYLSLGSNIGNREKFLFDAITTLAKESDIQIIKLSNVYDTDPQNFYEQRNFLNCVLKISTTLSPHELLAVCQKIEYQLGRKRTFRYGPRTIDIDILLYDDQVISEHGLIVPHPEIIRRNCILTPLNELAPNFVINNRPLQAWMMLCSDQMVKKFPVDQQKFLDIFKHD